MAVSDSPWWWLSLTVAADTCVSPIQSASLPTVLPLIASTRRMPLVCAVSPDRPAGTTWCSRWWKSSLMTGPPGVVRRRAPAAVRRRSARCPRRRADLYILRQLCHAGPAPVTAGTAGTAIAVVDMAATVAALYPSCQTYPLGLLGYGIGIDTERFPGARWCPWNRPFPHLPT